MNSFLQETKAKLQQEVNQIGNDRNSIQAQLEKAQHQEQKYQKELKELQEKNNSSQQSINAHNKKVSIPFNYHQESLKISWVGSFFLIIPSCSVFAVTAVLIVKHVR